MHKVLVCQHVPREILGTFHPLLKQRGFRIRYANFGRHPQLRTSVKDYDGLILLGGPMNVDDVETYPFLTHEIELIQEAIQKDIPVLGICLGSQLIAKALGTTVESCKNTEIGWKKIKATPEGLKDPLISCFNHEENIFEWHFDSFALPEESTLLATSDSCKVQAFRYGNKIYGFQFHLEVDEAMVEKWLMDPAHQIFLNHPENNDLAQNIREDCKQKIEPLRLLSEKTFTNFLDLFGPCKKSQRLSSR